MDLHYLDGKRTVPIPCLSEQEIRAVSSYLFFPDDPLVAEYTIVLGISLASRPVERAVDLYRRGLSGRLIFTGGYNHRSRATEAELMAAEARRLNIDSKMFLCECTATNTYENFLNALALVGQEVSSVNALNFVAIDYHARRSLLTARSLLPPNVLIGKAGYQSVYFDSENWSRSSRGRFDVLNELSKVFHYFPDTIPSALKSLSERALVMGSQHRSPNAFSQREMP